LLGAANVLIVQAVTFAISAVSLLAIRTREAAVEVHPSRPRVWHQVAEGLAFVARNRILRATAIVSSASNFAFAIASAVTFIFMSRTLGLPPAAIGVLIAAGSLTVVAGAAITPRLSRLVGSARIIWLSVAVSGPLALLVVLAQPGWGLVLLVVGLAAGEFGQIVYAITNVSLRQRLTPDRMLGRVTATMGFLIMGAFPLGALIGGVLGSTIGLRETLWISGGIIVLAPLPLYFALRGIRDVEQIEPWHREDEPGADESATSS
jgi:MFS family permease